MRIYKITFNNGSKTLAKKVKAEDVYDLVAHKITEGVDISHGGMTTIFYPYDCVKIEQTNDAIYTEDLDGKES